MGNFTSPRERDWYLGLLKQHLEENKPLDEKMRVVLIEVLGGVISHNATAPKKNQIIGFPVLRFEKKKSHIELVMLYVFSELFKLEALHKESDSFTQNNCEKLAIMNSRTIERYRKVVKEAMNRNPVFKQSVINQVDEWKAKADSRSVRHFTSWFFVGTIDFADPEIRAALKVNR